VLSEKLYDFAFELLAGHVFWRRVGVMWQGGFFINVLEDRLLPFDRLHFFVGLVYFLLLFGNRLLRDVVF
jgi:hypothetical protein